MPKCVIFYETRLTAYGTCARNEFFFEKVQCRIVGWVVERRWPRASRRMQIVIVLGIPEKLKKIALTLISPSHRDLRQFLLFIQQATYRAEVLKNYRSDFSSFGIYR